MIETKRTIEAKKVIIAKRLIQYLCLLLAVFLICPAVVKAAQPFEMHLLDVGQGQSVLVEADGHYMLIDGGGRDASSFVISYLRQQGVEALDYIILSHYDEDHMAGLIGALSVFRTGIFLVPSYAGEGDLYRSLATAALSNGCTIMHAAAGWQFQAGNANVEVIGPVGEYTGDNDRSVALRITYGDTSYLICGDAEQQSEMDMIRSGVYLDADVYVVSHHGSSTSSSDAFLDAMTPTYALISCGANNEYGHPSMETLQRLRNHGCAMFRTDKQGTVVAASDGTEIWFNAAPCEDWTAGNQIILSEGTDGEAAGETFRQMPAEGTDSEAAGETVRLSPEEGTGGEYTGGVTREIPAEEAEPSYQYVCNTNTKKFHYPNCKSVDQMKEEHRLYTDLSRDDLIAQGYAPCGNCNP